MEVNRVTRLFPGGVARAREGRRAMAQQLLDERQSPEVPTEEDAVMKWDQIAGNWKQFTGKVKEKWGKLTDDDLTTIAGKRDQLAGKLRERYGYNKEQAERELDQFARDLKT